MRKQLLKNIIANTNLSNSDLKKKMMKILVLTNDWTKVKGMVDEVCSGDFNSLNPAEIEKLIVELKNNNEQSNNNQSANTEVVNMLKDKIRILEKQLQSINYKINFEDNVYIINNGEVTVIPKNLLNIGSEVQ